jgi:valyl-tRNA synthetase
MPTGFAGLTAYRAQGVVARWRARPASRSREDPHVVPHGDRSGAVIEPTLTDQWYVRADVGPAAIGAVERDRPFRAAQLGQDLLRVDAQLRALVRVAPALVGPPHPAWYDAEGFIYVEETEEAARAAALEKHGRDVELRQDEDVLDTWFSSALWPFSTLGWPEETEDLRRFYPTSTLVTAQDIIFFWVPG